MTKLIDGRGRWTRYDTQPTVDDRLRLSVLALAKDEGLAYRRTASIVWTWRDGHKSAIDCDILPGVGVRLRYVVDGTPVPDYIVPVEHTPCNFGGTRPWFRCPGCRRRCRELYMGGRVFACRTCQGLTYATKQQSAPDRVLTTVRKRRARLYRRLGWAEGDYIRTKPPRMQWQTYLRLRREVDELEQLEDLAYNVSLLRVLGRPPDLDLAGLWSTTKQEDFRMPGDEDLARGLAMMARSRRRGRRELVELADLAQRAGVPVEFARTAVRAKLLRPDAGRGTRSPRYRARLASWLGKLHTLRESGMSWGDIRAWSRRRWDAGNEGERAWPAGMGERAEA